MLRNALPINFSVARMHEFSSNVFVLNLMSKSNSNDSTVFVRVLYVSPDANFVSTNCRTFVLSKYCYDLTAPDAIFTCRNDKINMK